MNSPSLIKAPNGARVDRACGNGGGLLLERSRIERAGPADLEGLVSLEVACFDPGVAISRRQFRYLLSRPTTDIWVCRSEGEVIADVVLLRRCTARGILGRFYSLVVAPEYRGCGYGRKLLRAGLVELQRIGAYAVCLEVRVDNEPALALYEAEGFRQSAILRDYYARGEHAARLRMDLTHSGVPEPGEKTGLGL